MSAGEPTDSTDPRGRDPTVFDALWVGVVNDWQNDARHTRFLDHARLSGALSEAARRYGLLRNDPERGEVATKKMTAVTLLVTHALYATASPIHAKRALPWVYFAAVVVCGGLLGWLAFAYYAADGH